MIRRALGYFIVCALLFTGSVRALDTGLENEVASVFGISRTISADAQALAHRRAVETSTDFSHNGVPAGYAEVIAWNNYSDPAAHVVRQWLTSPPHAAILSDRRYTEIGCGSYVVDGKYFAVCLLPWSSAGTVGSSEDAGTGGATESSAPQEVVAQPTTAGTNAGTQNQEPIAILPDTATER